MSLDSLATASKVERPPSAAVCLKLKDFDFEIVSVKNLLVINKEIRLMHLKVVDMLMTKLVLWIIRTHNTFMTAVTILSLPQMSMYLSLIIFNNQKHPHN